MWLQEGKMKVEYLVAFLLILVLLGSGCIGHNEELIENMNRVCEARYGGGFDFVKCDNYLYEYQHGIAPNFCETWDRIVVCESQINGTMKRKRLSQGYGSIKKSLNISCEPLSCYGDFGRIATCC